ncbi:o-succinylbenzoate--CoA ligase [Paenisporosarcina sp. TG20]|uniref:o-succinylbenzoate--CoA ligase n=1 Tax=Paenisporosarcina sp. TG20 TaxID=1211706 RepID=UPI00030EFC0E|nr:o-succinylbenzoate--CoA ligase [Paenisporosarcina sp. TG20]
MYPNWLMQRVKMTPNRLALRFKDKSWTFLQLFDEVKDTAGKMKFSGINYGDRIAILSPSNSQLIVAIHACWQLGCEIVLLNERLSDEELTYQIEDAQPILVLTAEVYQDRVSTNKVMTLEKLSEQTSGPYSVEEEWPLNRTVSIMYTSGTSGRPKGVRQTVLNHTTNATASAFNIGIQPDDTWLCAMPIFHISGLSIVIRSVLYGMEVKLYEKFDLVPVVDDLVNGSITRMSVVSVMLDRILRELEKRDVNVSSRMLTMLVGGGPVPSNYLERAIARGIPILQTYGMTETASQTATLAPEDAFRKLGSSGKPLYLSFIRIEGGKKPFDEGEICIRGGHVTPGYIGHYESTSSQEHGWLFTGDIGYFDDEGYLYVVDRRSDLIISGGENIYPAEVENAILQHPMIREAGVCGMDDETWGQVPVAFIVSDVEISISSLQNFLQSKLASYKIPKILHQINEMPRNASNKLLRRELRTWLASKSNK